jgi:serine/threonine protein kinase
MFSVLLSLILNITTASADLKNVIVEDNEGNRYKLVSKIGDGQHGDIYLAQEMKDRELLPNTKAVKVLEFGEVEQNQELLRNHRNAQFIAQLHPEYFLPFSIGDLSNRGTLSDPIIIMPALQSNLELEIANLKSITSRVELATETMLLFIGAANALMKSGYIHGDIMPANVGRLSDGRLVLIDYDSFSKVGDRTNVAIGMNAAPEFHGRANLVTDIYAMGITLSQVAFLSSFDRNYSPANIAELFKTNVNNMSDLKSRSSLFALELFVTASLAESPKQRQQNLLSAIQQIKNQNLLGAEHAVLLTDFEKTLSEKSQRVGFFRLIGNFCSDLF